MKNTLLTLCTLIAVQGIVLSQDLKVILTTGKKEFKPEIRSNSRAEFRTLRVTVPEGSGDYVYTWGASEPLNIIGEKSTNEIRAVMNEDDVQYRVFVEDKKTGKIGYASTNFGKSIIGKPVVKVLVYPNPSTSQMTIKLSGATTGKVPTKVDLFSEKSSSVVQSVAKDRLPDGEYLINTAVLPSGTYYIHVQYQDEPTPQKIRVVINH